MSEKGVVQKQRYKPFLPVRYLQHRKPYTSSFHGRYRCILLKMMNYYHLLSLDANASQPDIHRKYQQLRRDGSHDGAKVDWELVRHLFASFF